MVSFADGDAQQTLHFACNRVAVPYHHSFAQRIVSISRVFGVKPNTSGGAFKFERPRLV